MTKILSPIHKIHMTESDASMEEPSQILAQDLGVPREIVDLMLKALSTASEVGEIKFRTCYLSKGANEEIEEALTAYRSWLSSQQGQKL